MKEYRIKKYVFFNYVYFIVFVKIRKNAQK